MEKIIGKITDIIFRNEENGYSVAKVMTDDYNEITIRGYFIALDILDYYEFYGNMVNHTKYGSQLEVEDYKKPELKNEESILRYLSSGVIEGIGPKMAYKIVEKFGIESIDIIEEKPEKLKEIPGIGEKTLEKIVNSYKEKYKENKAIFYLTNIKIKPNMAIKLYNTYGEQIYKVIEENPYKLCKTVKGLGFKTADEIASKVGIDKNSSFRIEEGIAYVLRDYVAQGNTYMKIDDFLEESKIFLEVEEEEILSALYEQSLKGEIKIETIGSERRVYLYDIYQCESQIASYLYKFGSNKEYQMDDEIIMQIMKDASQILRIELGEKQIEAVQTALKSKIMILTGGPGTGKTTVVKYMLQCFKEIGKKVILCAPTGRAAKRLSEASNHEAFTIHRMLRMEFDDIDEERTFEYDEQNPIDADVVIIDEMSMVDVFLMKALLSGISEKAKIIFIGDADQLPSVGAGNVLLDMIKSETIPTIRLKEIYRQSNESGIICNAHKVNNGEDINYENNSKDFFFMERYTQDQTLDLIKDLITKRLPEYYHVKSNEIQILTPIKKGITGTMNINKVMQKVINQNNSKDEITDGDRIFKIGDKVMQIKNDYSKEYTNNINYSIGKGIYNGDIGFIESIDKINNKISVVFEDGKKVIYEKAELDNIELAYAITIHKSQGCEFDIVILPIINIPNMMQYKNILYTGITRAKKVIVLVGKKEDISKMIKGNNKQERYTSLSNRLNEIKITLESE